MNPPRYDPNRSTTLLLGAPSWILAPTAHGVYRPKTLHEALPHTSGLTFSLSDIRQLTLAIVWLLCIFPTWYSSHTRRLESFGKEVRDWFGWLELAARAAPSWALPTVIEGLGL